MIEATFLNWEGENSHSKNLKQTYLLRKEDFIPILSYIELLDLINTVKHA